MTAANLVAENQGQAALPPAQPWYTPLKVRALLFLQAHPGIARGAEDTAKVIDQIFPIILAAADIYAIWCRPMSFALGAVLGSFFSDKTVTIVESQQNLVAADVHKNKRYGTYAIIALIATHILFDVAIMSVGCGFLTALTIVHYMTEEQRQAEGQLAAQAQLAPVQA